LKDDENRIYTKKFVLFNVTYKRYSLFKIELYDYQFYSNYFELSFIKTKTGFRDCNNHEEIIQKFQKYFRENRIKVSLPEIDQDQNHKIAMNIDLRNIINGGEQPKVTIEIEKKNKDSCVYILIIILSLSKFIRIIFQIGEFYFSIILFGIYLETTTLLITASSKFFTWGWLGFILEILVLIAIFYFTNMISILPLVFQFWLASNLSYIKDKNPIKIIVREFSSKDNIDEINYKCEFIFDICFGIMVLLYIISGIVYNIYPEMFEFLNFLIFIFFPLIKLLVIYCFAWYIGFKVIFRYFNSNCSCKYFQLPNNDEELKKLVYYDKFERKIEERDSSDSFMELEPVKLFMYIKEIDGWFKFKFWSTISIMVFILFLFPICFKDGYTLLYLFFFFALSFPLSLAVPNHLFIFINLKDCFKSLCCCLTCKVNQNIINIGEKFHGLKYWVYIIQTLLNLSIIGLVIVVLAISSSSVSTMDKIFNSTNYFNNIEI